MPISVENERLVTFPALARTLPCRRSDRPIHVSTVHRWRNPGVRGVQLEAIRIGGAWHTTWEAFSRFCSALTAMESGIKPQLGLASQPNAESQSADSSLATDGW